MRQGLSKLEKRAYAINVSTTPLWAPPLEWNPAMMPLLSVPAISPSYDLGEVSSYQLFIGDHLSLSKSRGPCTSSCAWLAARIQPYIANALKVLMDTTLNADDYDRTASSAVMNIGMHLLMLLPKIFPSAEDEDKDSFILHHDDLHAQNILVDADSNLTGIIDWENTHASPLWYTGQLPKFICGKTWNELPVKSNFMVQDEDNDSNELVLNDNYWEYLQQYKKTQLRKSSSRKCSACAGSRFASSRLAP